MINKQWILGIDIGGSGVRCLLVNTTSGATLNVACSGWELPEAPGTIAGFDIDLGCLAVGKEPTVLPQSAIDKFRAIGDMIA